MATGLTARARTNGILLAAPALVWLGIFFVLPVLIVAVISVLTRGAGGAVDLPLTLAAYDRALTTFSPVLWDSLYIALITTVICLLIGYPMAFFIRMLKSRALRSIALFMVILPFWTNFLIRTYAWRVLLGREGVINSGLMSVGIISEPLALLNTPFAVIVGLIYGFLPFMVLPIYASVERFNFRYVEAAHDLGANNWESFWRVVLPMTLPGVVAGCILVFIPAIGSYVVPDLLGGTRGLMIGNLIQLQFRGSGGNLPQGAALSMILMGIVVLSLFVYMRFSRQGN